MKVYVRSSGGELMFPSFKEFQTMYRLRFIGPDDLVRRETSERWIRAGDMPELRTVRQADRMNRQLTMLVWLAVAAFAVVTVVRLFLSAAHP